MNLLVTGAWNDAKKNIYDLEKLGHNVQFLQFEKDALPCTYDWVEGVICNGLFLSHPIDRFVNLKYIQLTSAGYDRVDMEYIASKGIKIFNARGVYSIPMAEFALCGVLQLYKQSHFFCMNKIKKEWIKHRNLLELTGKNVGIVGCGNVGDECAKRFFAMGCNVIGFDVVYKESEFYSEIYDFKKIDDVLNELDILVLTLPLNENTKEFMNNQRFSLMKNDSVIVNIARGGVLDTSALLQHIDRLCGAVLDVFEEEPLKEDSPLWDYENIIITPHNSFVGEYNQDRLKDVIFRNLRG